MEQTLLMRVRRVRRGAFLVALVGAVVLGSALLVLGVFLTEDPRSHVATAFALMRFLSYVPVTAAGIGIIAMLVESSLLRESEVHRGRKMQ